MNINTSRNAHNMWLKPLVSFAWMRQPVIQLHSQHDRTAWPGVSYSSKLMTVTDPNLMEVIIHAEKITLGVSPDQSITYVNTMVVTEKPTYVS